MKAGSVLWFLLACVIALPARGNAQGFWATLGMSEEQARDHIWNGLADGSLTVPALPALRAMPAGARNSLIAQMSTYAKAWTQGAHFTARYAQYRDERKPVGAATEGSVADRKKHDREALQKGIKEMEANAKLLPPAQQGMMKEVIQQQKDQLKAIDDPNNPMYSKEADEGMAAVNASVAAENAAALKEWEARYPAAPSAMVRQSLRAFLAMSAEVDFNAQLVRSTGGKMTFANPDYESKPPAWKALFRSGKETSTALRAAAQRWLGELK